MQDGANNGIRALVVDDSLTVRRLMDLTLSPLGIDLEFADNGEDAIALVLGKAEKHYDIIFLDVVLPGVNGFQVCKAIKGNNKTKGVPVIMLTSKDGAFDKIRGMMAGSDIYLTKPLERYELMKAMKKHLPTLDTHLRPNTTMNNGI